MSTENTVSKIAVLTSGGDAPGMNACIRAVVRTALSHEIKIVGVKRGYEGLIEGDFKKMSRHHVSGLLQRGGTILKSARSKTFMNLEGRAEAAAQLRKEDIDGLIVIGGDGTFTGASLFFAEHGFPVVGCPGTIDNDLYGTDETIGFDTALNTALEGIDKIRDTADAHNRVFLIEVMGRDSGFLALRAGIAGGAELVLIPETITKMDHVKKEILRVMSTQRRSSIVVVAEGDELGGAVAISQKLEADDDFENIDLRVCVLGHTQRGGSPSARDRVLASRLGSSAVDALLEGHTGVMVGVVGGDVRLTPLKQASSKKKSINLDLTTLAGKIS